MKKILLSIVCALLSLSSMAQESEDQKIDGVWYVMHVTYKQGKPQYAAFVESDPNLDEDDNPLTKYSGDVVIPDSVDYDGHKWAVTAINGYAFNECTGLTSVKLPNNMTEIGNGAFLGCTQLAGITLPTQLTKMGDYAFNESGLMAIVIPDSCKSISSSAFADCVSPKNVTLGKNIAYIADGAFTGCPLTSLDIWCDCTNGAPYMVGAFDESLYETLPVRVKKGTLDNYYYKDADTGEYESDWHNFKNLKDADSTPTSIAHQNAVGSNTRVWYSLDGRRLTQPQKGVNILKVNGKTYKVVNR